MSLTSTLFSFPGQCIDSVSIEESTKIVRVKCRRDKRYKLHDSVTGKPCTVNRYIRRRIHDLPVSGRVCHIDIELAQARSEDGRRFIEPTGFVAKGGRYTTRFCHFISGLCRHMSIQAVSKHLGIRWETVKNIDKTVLLSTLPALAPGELKNLIHIGVDEVARAKGHDYMTVVYDLISRHLIWVDHGRTANVLIHFLKQLSPKTKEEIQAVSMDMGQSYQSAVRKVHPNADIVFDRFHVMQNYSLLIRKERNKAFRNGTHQEKNMLKGTLFLLLK